MIFLLALLFETEYWASFNNSQDSKEAAGFCTKNV